jgi:hypothetical protein
VRGSAAAAGESEPTRSPGRPGLGPDGPGFRNSRLGRARAAADSRAGGGPALWQSLAFKSSSLAT